MKFILAGLILFLSLVVFQSCSRTRALTVVPVTSKGKDHHSSSLPEVGRANKTAGETINIKNVKPGELVDFAETLLGIKYKYGSANKEQGFDCSGLITYVFNRFEIKVPRSSKDFTNLSRTIDIKSSRRGDIVLFTGTDTTGWIVGHMGIITSNEKGSIKFIHSSSGKNAGVIISEMSRYYSSRFVKAIRLFE